MFKIEVSLPSVEALLRFGQAMAQSLDGVAISIAVKPEDDQPTARPDAEPARRPRGRPSKAAQAEVVAAAVVASETPAPLVAAPAVAPTPEAPTVTEDEVKAKATQLLKEGGVAAFRNVMESLGISGLNQLAPTSFATFILHADNSISVTKAAQATAEAQLLGGAPAPAGMF